jgi:RimJ/RimL family protein N-acetyltransferase
MMTPLATVRHEFVTPRSPSPFVVVIGWPNVSETIEQLAFSSSVIGDRVMLGPLRREAIPDLTRWLDLETMQTTDPASFPMTVEWVQQWYDKAAVAADEHWFLVYVRDAMPPIGIVGLTSVDHRHRTAEHNIVIGAKRARGKGYGTEATVLLLDYAFTVLGLHNVWLRVFANNPAGIRAYEKAGFRHIGRRRESRVMGGRLWDTVLMECLADEFESPVLARVFQPNLDG